MFRCSVFGLVFWLLPIAAFLGADKPTKVPAPKLSDDAKKFIDFCNKQMQVDYVSVLLKPTRYGRISSDVDPSRIEAILHKRAMVLERFVKSYLVPRSRTRLIAYLGRYSPAELQKLNKLMPPQPRLSESDAKLVAQVQDDLVKIEDAVLAEIPDSKLPKFD